MNASILRALLYLRLTSARNWLGSRLRRLRQPKYLFGAIVGVAYFYFFFSRSFSGPRHARPTNPLTGFDPAATFTLAPDSLAVATAIGALLLLVIFTVMWVVPAPRATLGFTEAEIAFLFPAPVTRRALVHFRLVSSQLRSLVGAALMMLFTNRWSFLGGNAVTHAVGWWFIFSALNLHFHGAGFTLTRLVDLGVGPWRRRLLVAATVGAVIVATFLQAPAGSRGPDLGTEPAFALLAQWVVDLTQTAPLAWLLWPFRAVLGPFLAPDVSAFLAALGPALLLIVLHYLWVVRSAVAFEEAAIDEAARKSERREGAETSGRRFGDRSPRSRPGPFALSGAGRPEFAFLWKNLLSTWPYFTGRILLLVATGIVLGATWLQRSPAGLALRPGIATAAAAFALYTLIVGPQFARQDLRNDLGNVDLLKAYPLPGWQIILGELLAPTAILAGLLWLAILTLALTLEPAGRNWAWLTPPIRVAASLGLGAIVPALVSLQLLVPNAAVLLFPGWFQTTRSRGGGPEVVGQRMIFFFAQTLTMVLALIPALLIGAVPFAIASFAGLQSTPALVAATLVASGLVLAVLLAEVAAGVRLLGARFERLDLSAELRP